MKRVFLLASNPLFHRGIQTLLARRSDLEMVGAETEAENSNRMWSFWRMVRAMIIRSSRVSWKLAPKSSV